MDKISALMDGELDAHHADQQLTRLKQDAEAQESWNTFHLIGDAMRGERAMASRLAARVSERLAEEPTVLAPRRKPVSRVTAYALSAAASLSAVALVGWVAINGMVETQPAPTVIARMTPLAPPPSQLANHPSEGRMNEYLLAHQEYSPSTTLQGLAPYIRTVSATHSKGRE